MSHAEPPAGEPQPAPPAKKGFWGLLAGGLILVAAAVRFWGGLDESSQVDAANKLIDEARVTIAEASKLDEEGQKHTDAVFGEAAMTGFPGNRAALKPAADAAIAAYGKSTELFRKASQQFNEAAAMRVDQALKDYWSVKAKQMTILADMQDTVAGQYRAALDESVTDKAMLEAKIAEAAKKVEAQSQEAADLTKQADKLMQDNPGVFAK